MRQRQEQKRPAGRGTRRNCERLATCSDLGERGSLGLEGGQGRTGNQHVRILRVNDDGSILGRLFKHRGHCLHVLLEVHAGVVVRGVVLYSQGMEQLVVNDHLHLLVLLQFRPHRLERVMAAAFDTGDKHELGQRLFNRGLFGRGAVSAHHHLVACDARRKRGRRGDVGVAQCLSFDSSPANPEPGSNMVPVFDVAGDR